MLLPWLELPGVTERVTGWSERTGLDLVSAGTSGTADEIRDTALAQPLLAALALVSASAALGQSVPGLVCGHSIGELPALAVAGVLAPEEIVSLAAKRGQAMADAAAARPSGLSAVLGGDREAVVAHGEALGLTVATVNQPGQVVLGGAAEALAALAAAPLEGTRVRSLEVAGAFHTAAMGPAEVAFAAAVSALRPARALCPVVANADGAPLTDGAELLARLVRQLTGPVRFDQCLQTLARLGVTGVLEVAPAGTLSPMARKVLPGVEVLALRSPEDLTAARELVAHAASAGPEQPDVDFQVVSTPESGVVDLLVRTGQRFETGQSVAVVSRRTGALHIGAPTGGHLQEWLVSPGDPVRAGQPLAVLA